MGMFRSLMLARMFKRLSRRVPAAPLWYMFKRMSREKPHKFDGQIRINSLFPPYPSPAFDRFCAGVVCGHRFPISTYLGVTSACPCKCGHCSYAGRADEAMSKERLLDLVKQIGDLGTCSLGFTGGEPLVRQDLEELITAAGTEMATIVFTSGHGLTSQRAASLAKTPLACITVGIECTDAAKHDDIRQTSGSFKIACDAVRNAVDAGLYTAISTVAFRDKIESGELDKMYKMAEKMGAREFRVIAPVATGGMVGCTCDMLTDKDRQALRKFHINHNGRRKGPAVACFSYLESAEMFGCGAGYHHLYIDASGNVCPCDLTPLAFGNVNKEPLGSIWDRMGNHFTRPRSRCLMNQIAARISTGQPLPLPPQQSETLCPPPPLDMPLPEVHRLLFRGTKR